MSALQKSSPNVASSFGRCWKGWVEMSRRRDNLKRNRTQNCTRAIGRRRATVFPERSVEAEPKPAGIRLRKRGGVTPRSARGARSSASPVLPLRHSRKAFQRVYCARSPIALLPRRDVSIRHIDFSCIHQGSANSNLSDAWLFLPCPKYIHTNHQRCWH